MVAVNDLCAGYGKESVLKNISFSLVAGQLTGILGANGCGKTTLLKAICGILPHGGSCVLDGIKLEDCSPRELARRCSYIPQRSGITIDISVLDVVLMGFNPGADCGTYRWPGHAWEYEESVYKQAGVHVLPPRKNDSLNNKK